MLSEWLSIGNHSSVYAYAVNDFHENDVNRDDLMSYLNTILVDSMIPTEIVIASTKKFGWDATFNTLVKPSIPSGKQEDKMKKGRFGEVLICEILVQLLGYNIPVKKLQYQITANKSLPSTDAIAFEMKGDSIAKICFVESKLRIKRSSNPVIEAYKQLRTDLTKTIPDMERFVLNCLTNSKDPLAMTLLDFMMKHRKEPDSSELRIGLICDRGAWKEDYLISLNNEVGSSNDVLQVDIVHLDNLESLVDQTYSRMDCVVIDDE